MNSVVLAVLVMLILSVTRINVVIAMIAGATIGGLAGGLNLEQTISAFETGIGNGAGVALSYALLGAFAVAISTSGLPHILATRILALIGRHPDPGRVTLVKYLLLVVIAAVAISSQNIIPIHIAFIPLLIPPLLFVMAKMQLDRRLIACIITFGLVTPYMVLPIGFGGIYLNEILLANIKSSGLDTTGLGAGRAMLIPALGMLVGLAIAVLYSYRGKRNYDIKRIEDVERIELAYRARNLWVALIAIGAAFVVQIYTGSMVFGGMTGFLVFSLSGVVRWRESDGLFVDGMKMMAMIGFIMITAAGFAEVMRSTGEITSLVAASAGLMNENKGLAAFVMLAVGLLITLGIGSSFSTVPIISAIYVPLALQLGFSPMAIVALVGTAGALGDAGSPASDSTLGPTAGLNVDGQHDHIWDTVVPTFLHYNLPLLLFGWIAAMTL